MTIVQDVRVLEPMSGWTSDYRPICAAACSNPVLPYNVFLSRNDSFVCAGLTAPRESPEEKREYTASTIMNQLK